MEKEIRITDGIISTDKDGSALSEGLENLEYSSILSLAAQRYIKTHPNKTLCNLLADTSSKYLKLEENLLNRTDDIVPILSQIEILESITWELVKLRGVSADDVKNALLKYIKTGFFA